ncbi:MAG TPA: hypothetical protein VG916_07180 [Gemmatimonadaceae bacterium]|nr:hypothetical protein [Gemmatimonadaceae bacterium]
MRPRAMLAGIVLAAGTLAAPGRAAAQAHVLIVSGLGGEAKFSERFRTLSASLARALHDRFGVPDANITWLGEDATLKDPHYGGPSTSAAIARAITAIQAHAKPGDEVAIFLIGHGAGQDADSRISIPGPDVTATDLQRMLAGLAPERVAVMNLTSASGDMLPVLAAPGRVVITATKTSYERNESHFAEFFVDAFAKDVADVDKDGRVSLLEAFRYAARETKRVYDDASKIQTEHAQLSDDGSKAGAADPTGRDGPGMLARRYFFDAHAAASVGDARLGALYREKYALEDRVDSLRTQKKTMEPAAYEANLEQVLVALARKAREIRQAEGRP